MKIAPITNNNIQNRNIASKGDISIDANIIFIAQKALWNKSLPKPKEPYITKLGDMIFNVDYLHEGDAKIFEGKTIKEILQIRDDFKQKAEANFKTLKKLMKKYFIRWSSFKIDKFSEDNKLHAYIKSYENDYIHDFGPIEFSPENNSLNDINKMAELVEKIKNLTKWQRENINYKLKEKPPKSKDDNNNNDDDTAAAIICMIAGGL